MTRMMIQKMEKMETVLTAILMATVLATVVMVTVEMGETVVEMVEAVSNDKI